MIGVYGQNALMYGFFPWGVRISEAVPVFDFISSSYAVF